MSKQLKFNKGFDGVLEYPLKKLPEAPNDLASPTVGSNDWNIKQPFEPGTDSEEQFLEELDDLHHVRSDVARNEWPTWFTDKCNIRGGVTRLWEELSVDSVQGLVDYVYDDEPTHLLGAAIGHCAKKMEFIDHPSHNGKPFVHEHVLRGAAAAGIGYALQEAFKVKWYYGVVRPEEYAGYNCTGYAVGCPTHPSFPQGHSTVYGFAWKTIETLFPRLGFPVTELSETQAKIVENLRLDIMDTFKLGCHAREFAGVHYLQDGVSGWDLGQKVAIEFWGNNGMDPVTTLEPLVSSSCSDSRG